MVIQKKTIFFLLMLLFSPLLVNAQPPQTIIYSDAGLDISFPHPDYLKQGEDFNITFWVYNSSNGGYMNLSNIDQCTFYLLDDKGSNILRLQTNDGIKYNRSIEVSGSCQNCYYSTILGGNISQSGIYPFQIKCVAGELGGYLTSGYDVTPTGNPLVEDGTISVGILYLYIIIAMGFLFLGYLFLKSKSVWVTYTGLFLMIIGFTFLYYDLHLSNLYAQTIAINSGAMTTASGVFIMVARFLKLAPYIVAGIIAFASVKVLQATIKTRKSHDGWDNNDY
jgi:hypothetical protein